MARTQKNKATEVGSLQRKESVSFCPNIISFFLTNEPPGAYDVLYVSVNVKQHKCVNSYEGTWARISYVCVRGRQIFISIYFSIVRYALRVFLLGFRVALTSPA